MVGRRTTGIAIRKAEADDRTLIAGLLDEVFRDDPVSCWVFPDETRRREVHGAFMGLFVDAALEGGWVDVAGDGEAVALWLEVPAGEPEGEDDGPARMREAVDPDNERAELVGRATAAVHPTDRDHRYLLLIAVDPKRQGEGIGTALMAPVLERCDREGLPAYLEASCPRSRDLYLRLGFADMDRMVDLPGGPPMWPMWREPRPVMA